MKTGVIDVGGGFRGIYACGVLDYCLDQGIRFDLGIGVSAGSADNPKAAEKLRQRANRYNEGVALAREYERQGKALIVAPDDTCGVSTLSRDPAAMRRLYDKGYSDGESVKSFMRSPLGSGEEVVF